MGRGFTGGRYLAEGRVGEREEGEGRWWKRGYAETRYGDVGRKRKKRGYTLIKMKIKLSSYIRKFRVEQLQSYTYMRKGFLILYMRKYYANISPYMTLQLLHSEYEENFLFFFICV
jgi:hypothetical protein